MNQEQYLRERIEDQIKWYGKKAATNKRAYRGLRALGVGIALAIPIMSSDLDEFNLQHLKLAIGVAGAVVAFIEALLTLFKFRDNWTNYRNAAEALIQHKYLFTTKSAPYNVAGAFPIFVQNAEGIMSGERVMWLKQNTMPESPLAPPKPEEAEKESEQPEASQEQEQAESGSATETPAPETNTDDGQPADNTATPETEGGEGSGEEDKQA